MKQVHSVSILFNGNMWQLEHLLKIKGLSIEVAIPGVGSNGLMIIHDNPITEQEENYETE